MSWGIKPLDPLITNDARSDCVDLKDFIEMAFSAHCAARFKGAGFIPHESAASMGIHVRTAMLYWGNILYAREIDSLLLTQCLVSETLAELRSCMPSYAYYFDKAKRVPRVWPVVLEAAPYFDWEEDSFLTFKTKLFKQFETAVSSLLTMGFRREAERARKVGSLLTDKDLVNLLTCMDVLVHLGDYSGDGATLHDIEVYVDNTNWDWLAQLSRRGALSAQTEDIVY